MDFWYNSQIRQYRLQFVRAFSNFSVQFGANGPNPELRRVPCRYGEQTRIAASIIKGNSENTMLTCPFITCYIENFSMSGERRQNPTFVETTQVNERYYDEEQQRYTSQIGNRYTIEKYMPVPYDLTFDVSIWTNNIDIKEQLLEQILVLYNPRIDFQTSMNPLDWTMLSSIELTDSISWTSVTIPQGTETPIDISTLKFKVPIWLNPPAKIKTQKLIEEIIVNISEGTFDPNNMEWDTTEFLHQTVVTPGDYSLVISQISSLVYSLSITSNGDPTDPGQLPTWTFSKLNPLLVIGTSFEFNGITLTVSSTDIEAVIKSFNASLVNTLFSVNQVGNKICFINSTGGDNQFVDGLGAPLSSLGLSTGVYPGGTISWYRTLLAYGNMKTYQQYSAAASKVKILDAVDVVQSDYQIEGWIDIDAVDQNKLTWNINPTSLPATNLNPVLSVIDPNKVIPGTGLAIASLGQRYLLLESIQVNNQNWQIAASENDIIEYNGTSWVISFNSSAATGKHYVKNLFNSNILEFDDYWANVVPKTVAAGLWRVEL